MHHVKLVWLVSSGCLVSFLEQTTFKIIILSIDLSRQSELGKRRCVSHKSEILQLLNILLPVPWSGWLNKYLLIPAPSILHSACGWVPTSRFPQLLLPVPTLSLVVPNSWYFLHCKILGLPPTSLLRWIVLVFIIFTMLCIVQRYHIRSNKRFICTLVPILKCSYQQIR